MISLAEYADDLFDEKDQLLRQIPEEAEHQGIPAIHIPDEIGRLLQVLIAASGAKRILELGTLFGYSTIWMARVLPDDGTVLSLEANPRHAEISRRNVDRAGVGSKVEIREGPALETLETLAGQTYDLVFIDADKPNYVNYLDWALRLTRNGGLILADNTWRHGDVVAGDIDESARAMSEFNRRVADDPRLLSTMVPTRGGADAITLTVVR